MRQFFTFTKKEWVEHARTFKLLTLLAVFLIFGMMSPLMAKLLPQLMSAMPMDGVKITLPAPSPLDAYTQFFKNCAQMGLLVLLLLFSGSISHEISSGTLTLLTAKGLGRTTVIFSKYFASLSLWTLSFSCSALINLGYTSYLFPGSPPPNLFAACFSLWLLGAFLLAVLLLCGALFRGNYAPLLGSALLCGGMMILRVIPTTGRYNPMSLSDGVSLLNGSLPLKDRILTMAVGCALTLLCLSLASIAFKKRRL